MEKIYHVNINQKETGVAILLSDKVDIKQITRDKEEHNIRTKQS